MAGCAVAQSHVRDLRRAIPGVYRGFGQLYEAALAPGGPRSGYRRPPAADVLGRATGR